MTPARVPEDLARRYARTPAGRAWIAALPSRLERWVRKWGLEVEDGLGPWSGFGALVVPVRRKHERLVLKLPYPHAEAESEPVALRLWGGKGAVRLVEADGVHSHAGGHSHAGVHSHVDGSDGTALLLERLDASRRLQDAPFPEAIELWGGIMRELSIEEDDRPEWAALDRLDARAEKWSDELPERWSRSITRFPVGSSRPHSTSAPRVGS